MSPAAWCSFWMVPEYLLVISMDALSLCTSHSGWNAST
jgi:hypothetical protein